MSSKPIFLFLALFLVLSLCSCTQPETLGNNLVNAGAGDGNTIDKSKSEREAIVKEAILSLEGIKGVEVVISGTTVLIGVSTDAKEADEKIRLKEIAAVKAKQSDPWIKNIAITANEEIIDMIKEIHDSKQADSSYLEGRM